MAADQFPAFITARYDPSGDGFPAFERAAGQAADNARQRFEAAFSDIQKTVANALSIPRNNVGSLDLGVDQQRAAAAALQAQATAAAEVASALREAAAAAGDESAQARSSLAAAEALAVQYRNEAQAALTHVAALEQVQEQLNRTKSATDAVVLATGRGTTAFGAVTNSARSMRFATLQAGQQLQDVLVQFQTGTRASLIFAEQVPQLAFAFSGLEGTAGAVARFFAGPWGVAVFAAAAALGPLIDKLFTTGDALDQEIDKLRKAADQAEVTRQAKELFAKTEAGVEQAIADQGEALKKEIENEKTAAERAVDLANANLQKELAIRKATEALLEQAIAQNRVNELNARAPGALGETGAFAAAQSSGQVDALQTLLAKQLAQIDQAQQQLNGVNVDLIAEQAKRDADPIEKINKLYKDMANAAINAAKGNDQLTASLRKRLDVIYANQKAAVAAEQERERLARHQPSLGAQLDAEQGKRLLTSAQSYSGLSESGDNATLRALFTKANQNVDPKMVAWCAAFVNAVLATNGLPGTGSLSARSFLGYGEATNKPEAGDIVVLRRGNSATEGHVGFYAGTDKNGRVRVTGGNQGNEVSTESFARSDVLGFRRAPSAADSYKQATKEAKEFADAQQAAANKVLNINRAFDEQPTLIDRSAKASKALSDIIDTYKDKTDAVSQAIVAAAEQSQKLVNSAPGRYIADELKQMNQQHSVQALINAGDEQGAELLQDKLQLMERIGAKNDDDLNNALRQAGITTDINTLLRDRIALRQQDAQANELLQEKEQVYLTALQSTQRAISEGIANIRTQGVGAIKGLISNLGSTFDRTIGDYVTNKVLGPTFQALEAQVRGETPLDRANADLAQKVEASQAAIDKTVQSFTTADQPVDHLTKALSSLADAVDAASDRIAGRSTPSAPSFANDNAAPSIGVSGITSQDLDFLAHQSDKLPGLNSGSDDIVVLGNKLEAMLKDPFAFGGETIAKTLASGLSSVGIHLSSDTIKSLGGTFSTAIEGLYAGQVAGGLVLGSSGDKTGEALGGVAGEALGKSLEKGASALFGKTLGSLAGPLGGALGGILGGLVGSLFHTTQQGGVQLTGAGSGTTFGNNAADQKNAGALADSVQSGLQNIVDELGGVLGSYNVSIGIYNGKYRVNPNGGTKLGGGGGTLGNVDFGSDQQSAVQYAILNAIQDGAVKGIDEGAARLLQAGDDLNTQLQKALSFEQVFKDLKSHTDPVGEALDELNAKFENLKEIFQEAGATSEQYAQLEQEYAYERADAIKQATQQAIGSLQDLLSSLTTGDNGLSLRDRIAAAKQAYDPLAAQIQSGDYTNADEFSSAAQTYLQLEQQLSGSQQGYFDLLDQITTLTQNAVTSQQQLIDNATNGSTPFSDASGTSAVTGSINDMSSTLSAQLAAVNQNLGTLIGLNDNTATTRYVAPAQLNF